jgi:hypothetical protein
LSNDRWASESDGRQVANDNRLDDRGNARASESDGCDDGDRRGLNEGCVRLYWYNGISSMKCKDDGYSDVRGV